MLSALGGKKGDDNGNYFGERRECFRISFLKNIYIIQVTGLRNTWILLFVHLLKKSLLHKCFFSAFQPYQLCCVLGPV